MFTRANANVSNFAGYAQNTMSFFDGQVSLDLGLRWDYFGYGLDGVEIGDVTTILDGFEGASRFQPKVSVSWAPFEDTPFAFYGNYGRGISRDARGVIRAPNSPRISTTDFYQTGASYNGQRFSGLFTGFLIDRSNEQVYIPDDGTIEFAGPTRSYGFEIRSAATVTCGSTEGMIAGMLATVDAGEEVIVFEPFYENYAPDAILSDAKLISSRSCSTHFY